MGAIISQFIASQCNRISGARSVSIAVNYVSYVPFQLPAFISSTPLEDEDLIVPPDPTKFDMDNFSHSIYFKPICESEFERLLPDIIAVLAPAHLETLSYDETRKFSKALFRYASEFDRDDVLREVVRSKNASMHNMHYKIPFIDTLKYKDFRYYASVAIYNGHMNVVEFLAVNCMDAVEDKSIRGYLTCDIVTEACEYGYREFAERIFKSAIGINLFLNEVACYIGNQIEIGPFPFDLLDITLSVLFDGNGESPYYKPRKAFKKIEALFHEMILKGEMRVLNAMYYYIDNLVQYFDPDRFYNHAPNEVLTFLFRISPDNTPSMFYNASGDYRYVGNPNNPVYLDELTRLGAISAVNVRQPVYNAKFMLDGKGVIIPQHILEHRDEVIAILITAFHPDVVGIIIRFYGW